ncbi:MAG: type I-U CRISPR-associated helicase/endonuclease Cas3, partial [Bryobacteraceae bacterium]|nr:type I-U CRISPR-associated helicase/endonuclease Cas3 [Bryobacteraceae bacterium]
SGGEPEPVRVYQLRGGIYRDESWVRNPLQPTVVASTVDQVGSRLLFRGYGVSDYALPVHAGLIANDALILLDEAHCSKAFAQTLERIQNYRGEDWTRRRLEAPFRFVEMTATPSRKPSESPFRLDSEDRVHPVLQERLTTPKRTRFIASKVKSGDSKKLVAALVAEAQKLVSQDPSILRVAIMVNRVDTARGVFELLKTPHAELVVGRMRAIDREDLAEHLKPLKSDSKRSANDARVFVVATQCLEVGADLDFDALVTECASMDALLQRFGRLDRLGEFGKARAVILAPALDSRKPDLVYGEALAKTREWLEQLAGESGELDFGLEGTPATVPQLWKDLPEEERRAMTPPAPCTPALLPAHLDTLVQTSPRPDPEPAVEFFLHGREPASADVQVVWRADLDESDPRKWKAIVKLSPPVQAEALPVKLWAFCRWLRGEKEIVSPSDLEGETPPEELARRGRHTNASRPILVWRGEESTSDPGKIRPGDTIVLPGSAEDSDLLGYVPGLRDVGDHAFLEARGRVRLRLHKALIEMWPEAPARERVLAISREPEPKWELLQEALATYRTEADDKLRPWLRRSLDGMIGRREREFYNLPYPAGEIPGWVLEGKRRLAGPDVMDEDAGADEKSAGEPVSLHTHTAHVRAVVHTTAERLLDAAHAEALELAALWHDTGKSDERFQTLLHGAEAMAARFAPKLLAKGRFLPQSRVREHWDRSGLPKGFRHELISLLLAGTKDLPGDHRDLILHLVASHHGRCRPLAPVVLDESCGETCFDGVTLSPEERRRNAPHKLDLCV